MQKRSIANSLIHFVISFVDFFPWCWGVSYSHPSTTKKKSPHPPWRSYYNILSCFCLESAPAEKENIRRNGNLLYREEFRARRGVCTFSIGRLSPLHLYNLHRVFEWCQDWIPPSPSVCATERIPCGVEKRKNQGHIIPRRKKESNTS